MMNSRTTFEFKQYTSSGIELISTNIAIESPVSLTVNGKIWLTSNVLQKIWNNWQLVFI